MVVIYRKELPPTQLILKVFLRLHDLKLTTFEQLKQDKKAKWSASDHKRIAEAVGWLIKHGFAKICH